METRVGRRKFSLYAMDLETHNDNIAIETRETSMRLGCLINEENTVDDESSYFYNLDEFLTILENKSRIRRTKNKGRTNGNLLIYIYNLSFEYSFLLPYLFKWGFVWSDKINKESTMSFNAITTKTCSSVWEVKLKFSPKHGYIVFRDLSKIFGGGLGKVAKNFNLEVQKGEIDYRKSRRGNYTPTPEEKEYIFNDCRIIIDILLKMIEKNDKLFFKSLSMASYAMFQLIKTGYGRNLKPYKEFRGQYPFLLDKETNFLRKGVSGGITYAPAKWQFKEINETICHVDAHSMHPSSAYLNRFPYGHGEYFTGKPSHSTAYISCCRIRISYYGVKLHSIISLIGTDFIDDLELVVWDFEIATMKKCYNELEIEYIDGYRYKARLLPWRKFYKEKFEGRVKAKKEGNDFMYYFNKLLINSSYGKMLEKPHMEVLHNFINSEGLIDSEIFEKTRKPEQDEYSWDVECNNSKYTYLPVGSAIPAYSRVSLIEHALKLGWENITYFDTDSIFFIWNKETEKRFKESFNLNNELGGRAVEEMIDKAQFTAPKRYKTEKEGVATFKIGGFNLDKFKKLKAQTLKIKEEDVVVNYDEVNLIQSKRQVYRAFRVKGGTIIDYQDKEIKVPKKYEQIYKKNVKIVNGS